MSEVPPIDQTRKILLDHGLTEAQIKAECDKIDALYQGQVKDPSFRLWLVAQAHGIDAGEIKAERGHSEGTLIEASSLTKTLIREEMKRDEKQRTRYAFEGVVLALREGETSKGKDKVTMTLVDQTGRVSLTAYADATQVVADARLKVGDYVRVPQVNLFAPDPSTDDFFWTLTLPKWGTIDKVDRPLTDVFKNLETDAVKEGDPVLLRGIVTHLEAQDNDACSKCGRWVREKKPEEHDKCGDYETVVQTTHDLTVMNGSGGLSRVRFSHRNPKPKLVIKKDLVQFLGFWGRGNAVQAWAYEVLKPGATRGAARPQAEPKAAVAPTTAPGVRQVEAGAVAGDPGADALETVLGIITDLDAGQGAPWEGILDRAAEEDVSDAEVEAACNLLMDQGRVYEPVLGRLKTMDPSPVPGPTPGPVSVKERLAAKKAARKPQAAPEPAPPKTTAPTPPAPPRAASAPDGVPQALLDKVKACVTGFGGENRVSIVVNALVTEGLVPGTDKATQREAAKVVLAELVKAGSLAYADEGQKVVRWTGG